MILVSCMISWLRKAPKVILSLKVVAISWLKQLDDLSTVVVFVHLEKGLELHYILELHHDSHPPPHTTKTKAELTSNIHQELMEDMRKEVGRMRLELRQEFLS